MLSDRNETFSCPHQCQLWKRLSFSKRFFRCWSSVRVLLGWEIKPFECCFFSSANSSTPATWIHGFIWILLQFDSIFYTLINYCFVSICILTQHRECDYFKNLYFFKVFIKYHFSWISMKRKKDLVRAVHNRREPQRHLLEKNGTYKFC